jgi:hypothetical protein
MSQVAVSLTDAVAIVEKHNKYMNSYREASKRYYWKKIEAKIAEQGITMDEYRAVAKSRRGRPRKNPVPAEVDVQ